MFFHIGCHNFKTHAYVYFAYIAVVDELRVMRLELQHRATQSSQRLIRELKRRDRRLAKVNKNCDIVTAILQASSLKRSK